MIELLIQYSDAYVRGVLGTLKLASLCWLFGLTLGPILGYLAFRKYLFISTINKYLNFLFTSIPILVILFWLHYPAQALAHVSIDPFITSMFLLSTINIISISLIVEHGLKQIPQEYIDIAPIYGLSRNTIIYKIFLPMVIKNIAPSLINLQMLILHMTIFSSFISYEELFRVSLQINSAVYMPIEVFSILALFFIIISLPFVFYANKLNRFVSRGID
jgi:polar amino acid transport system permease protein